MVIKLKTYAPYTAHMSLENAHKLIRIYMGGLILGVDALYMLSCFLKQFALVGKRIKGFSNLPWHAGGGSYWARAFNEYHELHQYKSSIFMGT